MKGLYKYFIALFFVMGMALGSAAQEVTVGSGTGNTNGANLPLNTYYYTSWTEQLFTSDELNGLSGQITSISFQYFYSSSVTRTLDIYLGTTSKTAFNNSSEYVPVTELSKVFSGSVTFSNTGSNYWVTINLTTPFIYNGSGNLVVGVYDYSRTFGNSSSKFYTHSAGNYKSLYYATDGTITLGQTQSFTMNRASYRNNMKFGYIPMGVYMTAAPESLSMGYRPNGYWMAPQTVLVQNPGEATTVSSITNSNSYFTVEKPSLPFALGDESMSLQVSTGSSFGEVKDTIVIGYGTDQTFKIPISATAYDAVAPDVWELARVVNTPSYTETFTASSNLHNNYQLPGTKADGYDVVFKLTIASDAELTASITSGENKKMGLYQEGFGGLGGPSVDNNISGGSVSPFLCDFESGEFEGFNWENDASYPWVVTTNSAYEGSRCMKSGNNSVSSSSSTIQFTVDVPADGTIQFNSKISSESNYDKGYFYIDGNAKINAISGNGSWTAYSYAVTAGSHTFKWVYTKDTSVNSNDDCFYVDNIRFVAQDGTVMEGVMEGVASQFDAMLLHQGVYYLAASSTSEEFTVHIESSAIPAPAVVSNLLPADGFVIHNPQTTQELTWTLGDYTVEYQLLVGETNPPTNVAVTWTTDLAESYTLNLQNGKTYYWQVNERNTTGVTEGPVTSLVTNMLLPSADNIFYVTPNGSGIKEGSSWANAADDLNAVLNIASQMSVKPTVWVAEGTYYGDSIASHNAFTMIAGVNVYGGFAGTETALSQRDIANHPTILDGQRVQRVLYQPEVFTEATATVWDGFVLEKGRVTTDRYGGAGVYLRKYGTLRNSVIRFDTVIYPSRETVWGGGVLMIDATLENCEVYNNYAESTYNSSYTVGGGGVCSDGGLISKCFIHDNLTKGHSSNGYGGGLYVAAGETNCEVKDCRIENNVADHGGGIRASSTNITNCVIANNYIRYQSGYGGGVYAGGNVTITNCDIVNNEKNNSSSSLYGAGMYVSSSNTVMINTVMWGNRVGSQVNSLYLNGNTYLTTSYSAVEGGVIGVNGLGNITLSSNNTGDMMSPKFTNPTTGVGLGYHGGDWTLQEGSVLINMGSNGTANLTEYDFDGNERVQNGRVDIGAYESPYDPPYSLTPDANNIIYVSVEGAGSKDGSSWNNASDDFGLALALAGSMEPTPTIWVKEGRYVGDSIADHNAFTMTVGVNVYGGFAGTETELSQRNYANHPTILDGQNVQRVLCQSIAFTEATATVWDGFVIEKGSVTTNANTGGGVYLNQFGTLRNCVIRNNNLVRSNTNYLYGGGVYMNFGTLENCEIFGNTVNNAYAYNGSYYQAYGGGVYAKSATIINCYIHDNVSQRTTTSYAYGGGLSLEGTSSNYCTVKDCRIENNTSKSSGSGVYSSYTRLTNCIIANNTGSYAFYNNSSSYLTNCDIVNNEGGGTSGGTLVNCVVWGNRSGSTANNVNSTATYCAVEGGCTGTGNITLSSQNTGHPLSPCFTNPTVGTGVDYHDGDWTLQEGTFLANRGNNDASDLPEFDLAGNARIQQDVVDIGAYESPYTITTSITPGENNIVYVKVGGAGSKDGSSWANATDDLTLALTMADLMETKPTVWVAEGTYVGDSLAGGNAFRMVPGVSVYGGFAGTETSFDERPEGHRSTLDGQRVQRVLYQPDDFAEATAVVWDGFIIQNGRVMSDHGAGAYLRQYSTLRNCIIRNDTISGSSTGSYYGAGVYMVHATLENCELYGNYNSQGYYGGGVSMESYSTLTDCYIHDNRVCSSGTGGGIYAQSGSTITRCRVIGNNGGGTGGGIYASGGSGSDFITIKDCRIENNQCVYQGSGLYTYYTYLTNCIVANNALTTTNNNYGNYYYGAVLANGGSHITNCLIVNNSAHTAYAGLYCLWNSSNTLENTVVWGNRTDGQVSTIGTYYSSYLTVSYCAVEGGYNGTGNFNLATLNTGDALSPMFTAPTEGAGLNYTGGDWTLQNGSILVNRGNNNATYIPAHDFAGNDRIQNDIVDLGAYESPYEKSHDITPDANNVIYVTVEGSGNRNGSSWSNASNDLNLVMTMAALMDPIPEVWVKEGTYVGDSVSGSSAFRMGQGVNVYGGFAGTETERDQRDFTAHPTILDGQHVQRVLEQPWSYTQATATEWDGFIIQNGRMYYGDGCGASVLSYGKLKNCIIRNNTTMSEDGNYGTGDGGGMYGYYATIENCEIYGNKVSNGTVSTSSEYRGGGAYLNTCTMVNCYIHDNVAENNYEYGHSYGAGGGLYLRSSTLTGCTIINNTTTGYGGGVRAYDGSNILTNCRIENNITRYSNGGGIYVDNTCTVTGCVIANNTAVDYGGGISASRITLVNSTVVNNLLTTSTSNRGAGIYTYSNNNVLTNNIIWGNMRNDVPDQYLFSSYTPTLTYCAIQGGYDGTGNITLSAENEGSEMHPFFVHPTDSAGAAFSGGNWNLLEESFCINQGTSSISNITLPETDLAGNERVQMGAIDLGAYESSYNAVVITCDEHGIVYVTPTGAGNKDGSSWSNAADNLQLAVNRAGACSFGANTKVWVAQGTYQGRSTETDNAFVMPQNIKVYGGFVGNEAYDYDLSQRDLVNHASVLDGQGVQRVLFQRVDFSETTAALWDGFSLTNGGGSNAGAGAYIRSYGELRNCRIYGNAPTDNNTAGVYATGGTFTNCHIYNNQGYNGGMNASNATLTNCLIEGNTGTNGAGGIYINTYTTLLHCGIYNNTVTGNGTAGIYVSGSNGNVMRNTVIWGNNGAAISNPGYISAYYSAIEGGIVGTGNINLSSANTGEVMSPCFTDPASGDWTLQSNSILINKGVTLTNHPSTDLAGNDRIQQEVPDLGPFESAHTAAFDIVPDANGIVYVSLNGTGNGSSWANACGDLQFAINRAGAMDPVPAVWVAKGTYTTLLSNTSSAFFIIPRVNVYGGFAGNEPADYDIDERDFEKNTTILDGENTRRVLYQKEGFTLATQAIWDGFTISNGRLTNDNGAGVYMQNYASLVRCKVIGNTITNTSYHGSGIYAYYSKVINCEVSGNQGGYAAVYDYCSDIINTTIVNNTGSYYGGLYVNSNNNYQLTNLILWGNGSNNQYYLSGGIITNSAIQMTSNSGSNIALKAENDGEGEGYIRFLAPEMGIYQLRNGSAAIGIGNSGVTGLPEKDLAGRNRIMDGAIEPGAYEHYCTEYAHKTINAGSSYNFYGTWITEPGTYMHLFSFSEDCDSLVVADITMTSSVWYVTETGAGDKSGRSWDNASDDLGGTLALAAQTTGFGERQVWVAEGTYTGGSRSQNTAFQVYGGVAVYGGFEGNETQLLDRDLDQHPTILSASGNQVLLAASTEFPCTEDNPGLMDGFTMQGGQQVTVTPYMNLGNCTIETKTTITGMVKNCHFTGFSDNGNQSMLYLTNGAVMDSCTIHHNLCRAALVQAENATISHTVFYNNTCSRDNNITGSMFGAILNAVNNVIIDHCDFVKNRVDYTGDVSPSLFVNMENASSPLRQPKHTVIAMHNSSLTNSIVWSNDQEPFTYNCIAKDLASNIDYCVIEGGYYNGVGNISVSHEGLNLFSIVFQQPTQGFGYLDNSDVADWRLTSNSICLKHGSNGSDIGAYSLDAPAVYNIVPSIQNVIFVDAAGTGDGSSWADATPYLQYAVAVANTFDPVPQVWVKEGSYVNLFSYTQQSAFNITGGVNVYGGFAGYETFFDERDLENHVTYLDGLNRQRVLYQNEPFADDKTAVWDGFVIRNGHMDDPNFYNYNSSIILHPQHTSNLQYDLVQLHGAGAALMDNTTLRNIRFENNRIVHNEATGNNISILRKGSVLSMVGGTLDNVTIANDTVAYYSSSNSMVNSYLYALNAQINNCDFNHNVGKIALFGCEVANTKFEYNQVREELPEEDDQNEAQLYVDASTLSHCFLSNNNAVAVSRLFANAQFANTYLNCQFDHNNARAVVKHNKSYNDTFINCNICNNRSKSNTSPLSIVSGGIFHNTVVWGNRNGLSQTVHFGSIGDCTFNHCAVELGVPDNDEVISLAPSNNGTSQAYVYPRFLAPDAGDYELIGTSALVDAGDDSVVQYGLDLLGTPRVNDGAVDIGAYEYQCMRYREYSDATLNNLYPFYGEWLTESGQYIHRWRPAGMDCDSVVVLNLSFKRIIYVKEEGGGQMNGTSWENAYGDLRVACEAAGTNPLDKVQIWVAEGLYRGDGTSVNAFNLYPNVEMYGGLIGTELADYDLSQRDLANHVTILDGDFIQRVIYMVEDCTEESPCVVDGFTIMNGFSRQGVASGTALYLRKHCYIRNCKITENWTNSGASAVAMNTDDINSCEEKIAFVFFENCEITNNQGSHAVYSDHAIFRNCKISSNQGQGMYVISYTLLDHCDLQSNAGRAIVLEGGAHSFKDEWGGDKKTKDYLVMDGCLVKSNGKGGIYFILEDCEKGHSETYIINTIFDGNTAKSSDDDKGGAICGTQHNIYIINSTLINNQASKEGGALYGVGYHIVNSILYGNKVGSQLNQFSNRFQKRVFCMFGYIDYYSTESSDITYSAIEGGYPGEGNILINKTDLTLGLNGYFPTNNSLCIDNGTTEGFTVPEYDRAGNSRVINGRIDIGAYETNRNGRVVIAPDEHNIIYVSAEGNGTRDGSSWENATPHLQMAMNMALTFDPKPVIWMKTGVYDDLDLENKPFWSCLAMMPGVNVYGGFNGTEPYNFDLNQRNYYDNPTVLDGQNKKRVAEQFETFDPEDAIVWDGLIIKNGYNINGDGGGLLLRGGASIRNCEIRDNVANNGGGIYRENFGGGADILANTKICHNYAVTEGGGIFYNRTANVYAGFSPIDTIANCEISNNNSDRHGGMRASRANIIGCTIVHNLTELYALDTITSGNVYNKYVNCLLWGNGSRNYPYQTEGHDNTYEYCAVQGGREGVGNINLEQENLGTNYSLNYAYLLNPDEEIYRPVDASAVYNHGNNDVVYGTLDLAGKPRVNNIVEMGAYEYNCLNYRHMRVIANEQFVFYGTTLTQSGHYEYQWTPEGYNCDSLVSLDLEIRKIWFVKEQGTGDGSSWENAMGDLDQAIIQASNYTGIGTKQIWVAKGTYAGNGLGTQAFTLRPNVEIYGGFKGNESFGIEFDDRDLVHDQTVLTGSNVQRVLGNQGLESSFSPINTGYIDGFVIGQGYTTGNGGGIYAENYITVKNCWIFRNQAGNGAGVYLKNRCKLSDCEIEGNTALNDGGGAYVSSSTLNHCKIHNNLCDNIGGGTRRGGGIYGENATINNCLIYNNSALTSSAYGGGMYIANSQVGSQLLNCTMVNNYSFNQAGGVYSDNSSSDNEFINCVLWGNRTDLNTQQVCVRASDVPIYMRYCAVQGGAAGLGNINLSALNGGTFAPRFVSPSDNVGANYGQVGCDWHIALNSILANHGERKKYTIEYDLDGPDHPRIKNGRVDIGAYESNYTHNYAAQPDTTDGKNVIYVNVNNTSSNYLGNSWENAIPDLQMAINFAGDVDTHPAIWIAEGTYTGNGWPYVDAFIAMNGINLYGGFAGTESSIDERELFAHPTILDGQNIQRTLQQATEEYFKYDSIEQLNYAIYDGLTLCNGFVYRNSGGGVLMHKGELRNCTITNCHALQGNGGGLRMSGLGQVNVYSSRLTNNKAESSEGSGGSGGAATGSANYYSCLFANNSALGGSGGATTNGVHRNSTIVNNYASGDAGGVGTGSTVYNSILWGNKVGDNMPCSLPTASTTMDNPFGKLTVKYSAIEGGYSGEGNITLSASNYDSSDPNNPTCPKFIQPSTAAGCNFGGGNWRLQDGSVAINHGSNTLIGDWQLDNDMETRVNTNTVDMGAYESTHGAFLDIQPDANNIIYVTQNGSGSLNGSSWANATPYLQYAMERAAIMSPKPDIWIASGTYTGDGVPYFPAFHLPNGVDLYGGFAGNEPADYNLLQRDFDVNLTLLNGQNLQQIMRRDGANSTRNVINGITFINGRSIRDGGAADLSNCDLEFCFFVNNTCVQDQGDGGGALHINNCNVIHSKFQGNYSVNNGGAIQISGGVIDHCWIIDNTAGGDGGGIEGSCELYNSLIARNHAEGFGGGIKGSPRMKNCDVVKNTVNTDLGGGSGKGGGMHFGSVSNGYGGGVQNYMSNNIIWGNRAGALVSNLRGGTQNPETITFTAVEDDDVEYLPQGTGNIVLQSANEGNDPSLNYVRFGDPEHLDFSLRSHPQSMCIDAGNNSLASNWGAYSDYDLTGFERISNDIIDMGCFESVPVDCNVPTNLIVPDELITFTSATVTWTPGGNENQWIVYYMEVGSTTPTLVTVDENSYVIENLHPNRQYMVKVRSVCGVNEMSSYTVEYYFNTACDPESITWNNYLTEAAMLPLRDESLPSNSTVLFNWDYIDGADYYDLYLWRTDYGNGLPIPDFPVRRNLRNNYASVNLAASEYDGYGPYDHCVGWCEEDPPLYLAQYDTTDVAYYAWYVVAHKDCATIQSDTLYFNTGLPDLHVTALDCSYAQSGQVMSVTWSVRNDGTIPTPTGATWNDYIVLSYPINWDPSCFGETFGPGGMTAIWNWEEGFESYIMAAVPNLLALNPGAQYTNECNITIPEHMKGNVFLFVLSNWVPMSALNLNFEQYGGVFPNPYNPDPSGYPYYYMSGTCSSASFDEINECDNFFYKNIMVDIAPYPDLVPEFLSIAPSTPTAGDTITVNWQLTNQGAIFIDHIPVKDVIYFSVENEYNASVEQLGTYTDTLTLSPGETIIRSTKFLMDEHNHNTYYFFVRTDVDNRVYESLYEYNNLSEPSLEAYTFVPPVVPDLVIYDFTHHSDTLSPNEMFTLSYQVTNNGLEQAKIDPSINPETNNCGTLRPWRGVPWSDKVFISPVDTIDLFEGSELASVMNDTILYRHAILHTIYEELDTMAACLYPLPQALDSTSTHQDSLNYQYLYDLQMSRRNQFVNLKKKYYKNNYQVTKKVRVPWGYGDKDEGWYYLMAVTDYYNDIYEYQQDYVNNFILDSVYVVHPDIIITDFALNSTRDSVHYTIKNIGIGKVIDDEMLEKIFFNNTEIVSKWRQEINLLPGDSARFSTPVSLPCNFYNSNTMRVQAILDHEKNVTNNTKTINIYMPNPDFRAFDLVCDTVFQSGQSFTLNYSISNVGNAHFNDSLNLAVYLGLSPELNFITAELLKSQNKKLKINMSQTTNVTQTVKLPVEAQGTYYLYISVNDDGQVCEGEDVYSNYIVSSPIQINLSPYPDLVVTSASKPTTAGAGDAILISYTVKNQGIRDVYHGNTWKDKVYISNSPQLDDNAVLLYTFENSGPVAIGNTYSKSHACSLPFNLAADNYFIYVVVDADDELFEYTGEYNNLYQTSSFPITAYQLDLAVTSFTGTTSVEWNQLLEYTFVVKNIGSENSVSSWTDKIFLSTDGVLDGTDIQLASVSNKNALSGGSQYQQKVKVRIPYGYEGAYYLLAVADALGANPDVNPVNNVKSKQITISSIPVPDLEVSDLELLTEYPASGQPIKVCFKVTNVGDGAVCDTFFDRVLYSRNTYESGTQIANRRRTTKLQPGQYYYDTVTFTIPVPESGSFAVYVKANHNGAMYEMNTGNNMQMLPIVLTLNPPGDLFARAINHPTHVTAGETMTVTWQVGNWGPNDLDGYGCSDVLYLSRDHNLDVNDKLLGTLTYDLHLPALTMMENSLDVDITGVEEGEYYIIVVTDARNAFYEEDEDNNIASSNNPFVVELPILYFDQPVTFNLESLKYKNFKLDVGYNISETVLVTIQTSDPMSNAVNNIYVLHNGVGDNMNYDFSTDGQMSANSELYIPRTKAGYYGVSFFGRASGGSQEVTVEARILPFEVRSISPNVGANTGKVTVKLIGSKFRFDMPVYLVRETANGVDSIPGENLQFVNFNQVFVTFNLEGRETGLYSLVANNYCAGTVTLEDCFTVIEGEPGLLATNLIIPDGLRSNRYTILTLEFGNVGNTDIPATSVKLISIEKSFIGLRRGQLNLQLTELDIPLKIEGEPNNVLRPGVRGTISVYCYTSGGLMFEIKEIKNDD